jgi:hypothetical protein
MKIYSFILLFCSCSAIANEVICDAARQSIYAADLKVSVCLLKYEGESQYFGIRIIRENISKNPITLFISPESPYRVGVDISQNNRYLFWKRPTRIDFDAVEFVEIPAITRKLSVGEKYMDEMSFSEIRSFIKKKYDSAGSFSVEFRPFVEFYRSGEERLSRSEVRNLRRREVLRSSAYLPSYKDIQIDWSGRKAK